MAELQALTFPDGFLWGAATSSHQCEGGNTNNQWYTWERAGHIKTGESCGRACDWSATPNATSAPPQMGLNALRLSLEWSRIEPSQGEWDGGRWRAIARCSPGYVRVGSSRWSRCTTSPTPTGSRNAAPSSLPTLSRSSRAIPRK